MQKILWITKKFPPSVGGVQINTFNTALNATPNSAVVITSFIDDVDSEYYDKILMEKKQKVYRTKLIPKDTGISCLWKTPLYVFKFCYYVRRIAIKHKVDLIIFSQNSFFNLFCLFLLKFYLSTPFAIYFRGEDIPSINLKSNPLMKELIAKSDIFICNSKFTKSRLVKFIKKIDKPTIVSYPGVEDKFFVRNNGTDYLNSKFFKKYISLFKGKKIIYTVGRLDKRKGHDLVIKSLCQIIEQVPNVIYCIAGVGPYADTLKEEIKKYGLDEKVFLLGLVPADEIVVLHQLGDVFVMPNRILDDGDTEGFGIVFTEANASGKPVIGGRVGGALDAVIDGETGFLVDPYCTNELIEKIVYLLKNEKKADEMGTAGHKRAFTYLRWSVLVNRLEKKIEIALAGLKLE